MDLSTTASALSSTAASSGLTGTIDMSVLKSVQNLQAVLVSDLFSSLGLGTNVDAFA